MTAVTHLTISTFKCDTEKNKPFEPTRPYCRISEGFSWPVIVCAVQAFLFPYVWQSADRPYGIRANCGNGGIITIEDDTLKGQTGFARYL